MMTKKKEKAKNVKNLKLEFHHEIINDPYNPDSVATKKIQKDETHTQTRKERSTYNT